LPRPIDQYQRRLDITNAAIRILARGGASALTLKTLADELGGSITLVTHFFSNRKELFVAITDELIATVETEIANADEGLVGYERLWRLLQWMTPSTPEDVESEAGRIALIWHRAEHPSIEHFFDAMEKIMRDLLRERLRDLVPDDEVEDAAAFLRAMTNGLTLSSVEHPDLWPVDAVERALTRALRGIGVTPEPA
jgi:AcrR family transcriptional regulator